MKHEDGISKKTKQVVESQLEVVAHDIGETLGKVASQLVDANSEIVKSSREYIRENPVKSVTLAVAAGAAVGSLLTLLLRQRR